jgi:hypothetical protein
MPSKPQTTQCEVVIEIGGEGGSITLYGLRTNHGWAFSRKVIDQTPELIDEDWIKSNSDCVHSWEAALQLLDRYPWPKLYPISVYPDFQERIWTAVQERLQSNENPEARCRWDAICQR